MARRALNAALLAGLLPCVGCGDLFSAMVHHDYDREEDQELVVHPDPYVLVNGKGEFTFGDGCTRAEDSSCEDDTGVVATAVSVSGALASAELTLWTFTAGAETGEGEIRVSAKNAQGKEMYGSAKVQVVLPDGANVSPLCGDAAATAPYLVPRASELRVIWTFTLDGVERAGWTGEIPLEAPELTLVQSYNRNVAVYRMPDSIGAGRMVRSTLSESSFEYETYDPSDTTLTIEELSPTSNGTIPYVLHAEIAALAGRTACMKPAMTLTISTPEICSFGLVRDEPALTAILSNSGLFDVLPVVEGTCHITASVDGTSVSESFDLEVAPVAPASP